MKSTNEITKSTIKIYQNSLKIYHNKLVILGKIASTQRNTRTSLCKNFKCSFIATLLKACVRCLNELISSIQSELNTIGIKVL